MGFRWDSWDKKPYFSYKPKKLKGLELSTGQNRPWPSLVENLRIKYCLRY
jgi:hypothetical protein